MNRPNVLLIHADQLRFDCLSPYGNPDVKTPALEALARESALCEQHYCSYPICTPSRYSLLSGQYAHQHLGWGNHCTFPSGLSTFPKELRKHGWHTAAVGKMHFTPTYLDMGFDRMTLAEQDGSGRFDDDYHRELKAHGLIDDIDLIDQRREYRCHANSDYFENYGVAVSDLPEQYHSTSWTTRQALREIDTWKSGEPSLLMVGYIKPHHPFDPPARYAAMYDPDALTLLPGITEIIPAQDTSFSSGYFDYCGLTEKKLRRMLAYYYACITQIDDGIASIIALLKQKGLYENTMILFTSDHGDYMGFHHLGLKGNHMYDPVVHVPLIIRYPNGNNQGRIQKLNSNVDVAGEILRTCGLPIPPDMSDCPLQQGRKFVVAEQLIRSDQENSYCYMVRDNRYKLLVEKQLQRGFLFDMQQDPDELRNRFDDSALKEVKLQLYEHLLNTLAFDGAAGIHLDESAPVNRPENAQNDERRHQMQEYFYQASRLGSRARETDTLRQQADRP